MGSSIYNWYDFLEFLPPVQEEKKPSATQNNDTGWLSKAMQGCSEGQRNTAATKLVGYFINKLPVSDVRLILKSCNQSNSPPLSDQELH